MSQRAPRAIGCKPLALSWPTQSIPTGDDGGGGGTWMKVRHERMSEFRGVRCCTGDEGRLLGAGLQEQAPNRTGVEEVGGDVLSVAKRAGSLAHCFSSYSPPERIPWLVLRPPENLTDDDRSVLARLAQLTPILTEAVPLAPEFIHLLRAQRPELLDAWGAHAGGRSLSAFRRLAASSQRDAAAITAGVALPWSTGPVEGHIDRLKLRKRQMFGRAKVDRLASRLLAAA
jgi:transposase